MRTYQLTQTCGQTGETVEHVINQQQKESMECQPGFKGWAPGDLVEIV